MQKNPDFEAELRPYTKNSYGSQKVCKKTSRFSRKLKQSTNSCSKLFKYGKRFRFAPSFNNLWEFRSEF